MASGTGTGTWLVKALNGAGGLALIVAIAVGSGTVVAKWGVVENVKSDVKRTAEAQAVKDKQQDEYIGDLAMKREADHESVIELRTDVTHIKQSVDQIQRILERKGD